MFKKTNSKPDLAFGHNLPPFVNDSIFFIFNKHTLHLLECTFNFYDRSSKYDLYKIDHFSNYT